MIVDDKVIKDARKIFNKRGRLTQEEQSFLHDVIVDLKDNNGMSFQKIGRLMNKSKGTISNYYHFENQGITREVEALKQELKEKDRQIKNLTEELHKSKNTINQFCSATNYEHLKNLEVEYEQKLNEIKLRGDELQNKMNVLEQERANLRLYMPQNIDKILNMPNGEQIAWSIINQNLDLFYNRLCNTMDGQVIIKGWLTKNIKNPAELMYTMNVIDNKFLIKAIFSNKN